ncbi:MAG: hypothetical protein U0T32_04580, partial [Chitinophagales bacterium]
MVRVITDHKHNARVKDCSGKPAGPLEAARGLAAKSLTAAQRRARPKAKIRQTLLHDVFQNFKS